MSVMEDIAGQRQRRPWWKMLVTSLEAPESREPITLAFDRQRMQVSMTCPRCARSMRLVSSHPGQDSRRGRSTVLCWHCETCGVESQRSIHC